MANSFEELELIGGSRVGDFFKQTGRKIKGSFQKIGKDIKKFFSPDLENFPKSSQNILRTHGDNPIVRLKVARTPLSKGLQGLLNAITLGKFTKVQKQKYSDLFHLFLVAEVRRDDGSIQQVVVEKNERPNVATSFSINAGTEIKDVPLGGKKLSVNEMLDTTIKAIGKRHFFQYRAFSWNCQDFIINILRTNGLLSPKLQEFILQDTEYLVKKLPKSTEAIANLATDTGALVSKWLGRGKKRGGSKASGYIRALMAKKYDTKVDVSKPDIISENLTKMADKKQKKKLKKLKKKAPLS